MKFIIVLAFLSALVFAQDYEDTDVWNITLQVEEVTRGVGFGFLEGMNLTESAKCFKEMDRLVGFLKELKRMIDNDIKDFKSIAKIVNEFCQWFAAQWYACGALKDFGPEFSKYLDNIGKDIGGYIGKVFLGLFTKFFQILNEIYWMIYHHAREEYFFAGNALGKWIYERFFYIVKP